MVTGKFLEQEALSEQFTCFPSADSLCGEGLVKGGSSATTTPGPEGRLSSLLLTGPVISVFRSVRSAFCVPNISRTWTWQRSFVDWEAAWRQNARPGRSHFPGFKWISRSEQWYLDGGKNALVVAGHSVSCTRVFSAPTPYARHDSRVGVAEAKPGYAD